MMPIPPGSFASGLDTSLVMRFAADEVQRHVTQHRHGLRPGILANPTVVFAKAHVKDPMERILDAPMLTYRLRKTLCITPERGQEITPLNGHLSPNFHLRFDHANTRNGGPRTLDTGEHQKVGGNCRTTRVMA